ncbi:ATPase [Methylobacterium radiotolerans]|nr:ATPase [Methylobacterium radiotolerans]KTS44027.1 ATPase [Methylobacterium radiotolerans]ONF47054.1 ATPase [Methylobacterium radiotolerans]OXE38670.1 ATPase [Methylobacterium radiotolerans]RUP20026.1 MAG: ATPase [Methylobacterium sp.]
MLARLGEPGAYARPDPLVEEALVTRRGGDGISVGSGRFAAASGRALAAADLATWNAAGTRLTISEAGRARLRREARPGDLAFADQHRELAVVQGGAGPTLRNAAENPLAWMVRRRDRDGAPLIDAAAFEAGERLRRDMTAAALLPRMGADLGAPRIDGGGPRDPASAADHVIAARQRVRGALDAVGSDLSGLLIDLCGFLKGLERIEAERRWPARSAKVVARIALGRLAEHYGLEREATGPDRARLRLWRG